MINCTKKLIILFTCFLNFYLFSQNKTTSFIQIEYDVVYNTEIPNTKKAVLEVDLKNNSSVFFLSESSLKSGVSNDDNKITLIEKNGTRYLLVDKKNKKIESMEFVKKDTYLVTDTITISGWNTDYNETKKIGESTCNKATIKFRGRNFIAWYDNKIPGNFGPWKFQGLPGIILEVNDETNRYHWTANRIKHTENQVIHLPSYLDSIKKITLKEYVEYRYNQNYTINASQLPRGIETQYIKGGRNEIEIKFEWE